MPAIFQKQEKEATLAKIVLFTVFAGLLLFFKFCCHELWKDEWQAWLVARDLGWSEMLGFLYYEGHPALWYVYLKLWSYCASFAGEAFLLQLSHSLPVLAGAYILVFRFNFSILLKVFILFSYHFFFEYGIVNRGYTLVILLGFTASLLLRHPEKNSTWLALVLFALCQTEVYGLLICGGLLFYLMLDRYFESGSLGSLPASPALRKAVAAVLAGALLFLATVYPRGDQSDLTRAYLQEPFSGEVCAKAFQGSLANTYAIGLLPDTNISGVSAAGLALSALIFCLLTALFWRDKRVLFPFLAFTLVLFLFLVSIYTGGVRQWGMGFIFWILCLQLWSYRNPATHIYQSLLIGLILLFQLVHNLRAVHKDFYSPFSNAVYAGAFIKEKVPPEVPVVAINKFEATPVVGYAGRAFYELPQGTTFTFFKWLEKIYIPPESELELFARYKQSKGLVVVTPDQLDPVRYPRAELWKAFDRYSFKNEQYYIYLFEW